MLSAITLLAGCAPASDGEVSEPAAGTAGVVATGAPQGSPHPARRDIVVLALEQGPQGIRVTSSARVERAKLGPAATRNGRGTATHRWLLVGPSGATLAEGEIAARGGIHVAPSDSRPAAHADPEVLAFVVRVPQPEAGEHVEVHALDGTKAVLSWP